MNDKVILYPQDGKIVMCFPCECGLEIDEIARKDVPAGLPYLIVDRSSVPDDFRFSDAFECDFSNPDGFGIGAEQWFLEQAAKEST